MLGSAAGGGFPQWNCGCPNCRGVRLGSIAAQPRSQESVAISADGDSWFLLNASPEIRTHIESFPPLQPRAPRHTPIAGILLTNGDLDHCLGLLSLRESQPLTVYATEPVRRGFVEGNVLYGTLERFSGQVTWRPLRPGEPIELAAPQGPSGLLAEPIAVPGQPALHLRARSRATTPTPQDNIGFRLRDLRTGGTLAYFSGVGGPTRALEEALRTADGIFLDGTFWASDELIALGLSDRRAEDMAHWPIGGAEGSLRALAGAGRGRRIFIHVNNTNPILREDSPERAAVAAAGWEVAHDGLELEI
ncbi:MAG TPA: pyrroloquinoline quinone biosynthesis protein PqqB [Steroidobacteraceae bacterium]|nr:pyrroloquinoline quinone biosynthesis protein PqqB [Steroidobacteraceae bacterium]